MEVCDVVMPPGLFLRPVDTPKRGRIPHKLSFILEHHPVDDHLLSYLKRTSLVANHLETSRQ